MQITKNNENDSEGKVVRDDDKKLVNEQSGAKNPSEDTFVGDDVKLVDKNPSANTFVGDDRNVNEQAGTKNPSEDMTVQDDDRNLVNEEAVPQIENKILVHYFSSTHLKNLDNTFN